MTKKPKTGGEIDSYCTKCKLDLTHRIIAMVGEQVKKVECKTCGSHHLYRKPKTLRDVEADKATPFKRSDGAPAKAAKAAKPARARTGKTASERGAAAAAREREQTAVWEKSIAGQPSSAFQAYRITSVFAGGELIRHSKFGDGVVYRVLDRGKVEVLFQDGPRTMAHGQTV